MEKYYAVVVQMKIEDEKGKIKKQNEQYLVKGISCLDAETITTKKFVDEGSNLDFKITSVKETKVVEVL